jgi:hypothetical protein
MAEAVVTCNCKSKDFICRRCSFRRYRFYHTGEPVANPFKEFKYPVYVTLFPIQEEHQEE